MATIKIKIREAKGSKMYIYFVSFASNEGFGNGTVNSKQLFTTIKQIREAERVLKEDTNDQTISIISFQLLNNDVRDVIDGDNDVE